VNYKACRFAWQLHVIRQTGNFFCPGLPEYWELNDLPIEERTIED
jgi:hypothetical protein